MQTDWQIEKPIKKEIACAMAMMIKAPKAGESKTRLVPPLTHEQAAGLSACFMRDTAANIAGVVKEMGGTGVAIYTPLGSEAAFDGFLPDGFQLLTQRGAGFGDRLLHATQDLLAMNYKCLCLIDSDSPTLPPSFLARAMSALQLPGDRVVLGEAEDGGYYLIGLKHAHGDLFKNIDWSTPKVLAQTIKRASEINLEVELLPPWYDVDDENSLGQLCEELFPPHDRERPCPESLAFDAFHTRNYLGKLLNLNRQTHIWPNWLVRRKAAAV